MSERVFGVRALQTALASLGTASVDDDLMSVTADAAVIEAARPAHGSHSSHTSHASHHSATIPGHTSHASHASHHSSR